MSLPSGVSPASEPTSGTITVKPSNLTLSTLPIPILFRIITYTLPSYHHRAPTDTLVTSHRHARKTLAPCPPPTALMLTNRHIHSVARAAWLAAGPWHLYVSSWTAIDEDRALMACVPRMEAVFVTLDLRAGGRYRVLAGSEGLLRASVLNRQIRALVEAMSGGVRGFALRVVVGRCAGVYVGRVVMEAWRGLRVGERVQVVMALVQTGEGLKPLGAKTVPAVLGKTFLSSLVAGMVGKESHEIAPGKTTRTKKSKKVLRRIIIADCEAKTEKTMEVASMKDALNVKAAFEDEGHEVEIERDEDGRFKIAYVELGMLVQTEGEGGRKVLGAEEIVERLNKTMLQDEKAAEIEGVEGEPSA